ncbi:MAG: 50S ribosomal protein L25/general stress protein Ctc [Bacteroidetes bacterium]|nr:50S ribosomal protein L25/general stress protein Ctc [Bacteroidota bacterium]
MKAIFMSGSSRTNVGKKDAKALRGEGLVPCVLYGGGKQIHFSAPEMAFKPLLYTPDVHTVELEIEGAKYQAILQDIQFHAISDKLLHADFLEVSNDKPVNIAIPVKATGNSVGVRAGGKLKIKLRKLKVRALLNDLPDTIDIDITPLEIGQGVKIGQLEVQGVTFLESPNIEVLGVSATRASRQAAQDEGKK